MQVQIHASGIEVTAVLREQIMQRLGFALSRFDQAIQRIVIHLADENGPRGGVDKHCTLRIKVGGQPELVVTDSEAGVVVAIGRAISRAGRSLARRLQRSRRSNHGHLPRK